MITSEIKQTVRNNFREEIDDGNRNVYFSQFHSSKNFSEENIEAIFKKHLEKEDIEINSDTNTDRFSVITNSSVIFIWAVSEDRWLFAYSTELNRRLRDDLDDLSSKIGWLLDVWIPGDVVNELFHEFSPGHESVNIERRWDPYWIYERGAEIPQELLSYYNQNYEDFVEQEIEFSLKTPKALVDETLAKGVKEDLLEKSEISESKFTYSPEGPAILNDGGTMVSPDGPSSRVTVRQRGVVVHSTGEAEATFDLLEEVDTRTEYHEKFKSAIPSREYSKREDGSLQLQSYSPGKILKFTFSEKGYNQEASLKLSNILTVGHSDVDLHGTVEKRMELDFFAKTYTSYDDGEFEIFFTEEEFRPVLYIKPVAGKVSGLVYIYQKLREKFDPRIMVESSEEFPIKGGQ